MDPESVLPVMEVNIKDENSFENQNDLQSCSENQIIQSSSNTADFYDFIHMEVPKKIEVTNAPLNQNIKEEPREVGTTSNLGGPSISSKSKVVTDVDFNDSGLSPNLGWSNAHHVHQLPTSLEEPTNNPWDVCSLFEFNYFCCPECEFKTRSYSIEQSAQDFVNHASHNHPWAVNFLQQISDGSIDNIILSKENDSSQVKVEIKQEPEEDFDLPLPEFEFEAGYLETEMCDELTYRGIKKSVQKKKIILKKPKKIDRNEKPKMSLSQLISEALVNSSESMSVSDIAKSISAKYPFYKLENQKWQNSLTSRIGEMERKNAEKKNAVVNKDAHVFKESNISHFSCSSLNCNYKTMVKEELDNHIKYHKVIYSTLPNVKDSFQLSCPSLNCNYKTMEKTDLDDHIKVIHPIKRSHQGKEKEAFEFEEVHIMSVHEERKTYQSHQCTICKREFVGKNAKRNMNDHVAVVHEGKKPFQCEICNSCFSRERNLRAHISFVHEGNTPFQCTECNEGFGYKHLFDRHIKLKHDKIPYKPYQCPICKKQFSGVNGKRNMNQHVAVVHEGKKPFECELCNACFSKKVGLETHISMVHDGNKSFECNLCQFATATENNLKAHIKSVHAEKESYECTICKKVFSGRNGKRNMRAHMEVVHEGKKPFLCEICDSSFSRERNLRLHISSIHDGNKPFKCNLCEYATVRKSDLEKHIKAVHDGIKPYSCDLCEKQFANKGNLTEHIKKTHDSGIMQGIM